MASSTTDKPTTTPSVASTSPAANRISFAPNPSPPTFLNPFNSSRRNDMTSDSTTSRIGAVPFSSHFTFTGAAFLPPSSTQNTNTNSQFSDSSQTYKSPPPPISNLDSRLPVIPTPPSPKSLASSSSARQTYATSTPGTLRHTTNETANNLTTSQHHHHHHHHPQHHHAPPVHSPVSDAGPPFNATETLHRLYLPGTVAGSITMAIHPKVDRGFFVAPEDSEWTCYRRNYFQISVAYSISSPTLSNQALLNAGIMLDYHGRQERVTGFKLAIGARVHGADQKIIDLVQHTPKRDKGPQLKPALNLMTPGGDVDRPTQHDHKEHDDERPAFSGSIPEGEIPKVVTYERIQFKQATANNGKRRAAQQYFCLIVEAYAVILSGNGTEEIRIAVTKSSPVVVRGRSPGHYSDTAPSDINTTKRPMENPLTTSPSIVRDLPSPTSLKSTSQISTTVTQPLPQNTSTLPQTAPSLPQTTPTLPQRETAPAPEVQESADVDLLASLDADFDGYQYLPFTLLDPQGKTVVPHDLFYDPHEFPDTHYANLLFGTEPAGGSMFGSEPGVTTTAVGGNGDGTADGLTNLYQGFFDFPAQDVNWNPMGRGSSQQGGTSTQGTSPFPKDRLPGASSTQAQQPLENTNWFENPYGNNAQSMVSQFRPNNGNYAMGSDAGAGNGNGGKWMFEFRNSSYGYFPNLPALGDMHSN